MGRNTTATTDTATDKKPRTRKPLNKYTAAQAIEKILSQIPREQHEAVLVFVREGRQTELAYQDFAKRINGLPESDAPTFGPVNRD